MNSMNTLQESPGDPVSAWLLHFWEEESEIPLLMLEDVFITFLSLPCDTMTTLGMHLIAYNSEGESMIIVAGSMTVGR